MKSLKQKMIKMMRFIIRARGKAMLVILNEVKNLTESIGLKTEILRLMPQNDITNQSHQGEVGVRGTPNSELRTPNYKGVTLVEVITVLAILTILAAVVIPKLGLPTTTSTASVDGAAYMVASDIRYAQEFAMANRVSKSVNFTSGSSTYTFSPSTGLDPSGRLPSGVTINNNYTITFNSLGEPTTGGGGSVTVTCGGQSRTIGVVNYTGKANIS